jgi:hypothetical protein
VSQHPDWILKDASGNRMYIPWGCGGGSCPQYAGDISNAGFRQWWISETQRLLAKGYKGIWLDDVNMQMRVGDRFGTEMAPRDPNTGTAMTWDNWRRYIAEFVEAIRGGLPGTQIMHNSIWFAGPGGVRDQDPYIRRQIAAADFINCERGISDAGLTGGNGEWSVNEFFAYVDRVHALGKSVVFDDYFPSGLEYPLAGYLLISNGIDGMGELISTPDRWWRGYDVDLGTALGNRYSWNGLLRRDFAKGMVLLNLPQSPTQTVTLPGLFKNVDGVQISSLTLGASQGAVLTSSSTSSTPFSAYMSDLTPTSSTNGWGPVEKDRSNNDFFAGDGLTMTINGVPYSKGLGAHAPSEIRWNLGGLCSTFTAEVGVDNEVPPGWGSIVFQVWADGVKLYDSGMMGRGSATKNVSVSVAGKTELALVITDGGNGITWDHGDWGNAKISCQSALSTTR